MTKKRGLGGALTLLLAATCQADTVWLKNGDRISGAVQSLDSGKLLIKMPNGRDLVLEQSDIATLQTDTSFFIVKDTFSPGVESRIYSASPDLIRLEGGEPFPMTKISSFTLPTPFAHDFHWGGRIDIDLDSKREVKENTDKLKTEFEIQLRNKNWRHQINGESEFENKNDDKSSDHWFVNYALDRLIDAHWFWRVNARHERNQMDEIQLKQEFGTGPGYRFWDHSRGRFELFSTVERDYYTSETTFENVLLNGDFYFSAVALGWDWLQKFHASDFELYFKGKVQRPEQITLRIAENLPDEVLNFSIHVRIDYMSNMEFGLRYNVNQFVHASLHFEHERTASNDLESTSRRHGLGLGARW